MQGMAVLLDEQRRPASLDVDRTRLCCWKVMQSKAPLVHKHHSALFSKRSVLQRRGQGIAERQKEHPDFY